MLTEYSNSIETILSWSKEKFGDEEFVRAREEFFWKAGKVFDDDDFFDQRMIYFWHHFVLERPTSEKNHHSKTPLEIFAGESSSDLGSVEPADLFKFYHGLFRIKKITNSQMLVVDLLTGFNLSLSGDKNSNFIGFEKGDIFQGYIFFHQGSAYLSGGVICHDTSVYKQIKKFVKSAVDSKDYGRYYVLWKLAKAHLDSYRYNRVPVQTHYELKKLI